MGIIIYFHNVVTHFGARYKQKIQKIQKNQKILEENIYIYIYQ
jgi:putative transposon-encoded protein